MRFIQAKDKSLSVEKLGGTLGKVVSGVAGKEGAVSVRGAAASLGHPGGSYLGGVLEVVVVDSSAPDLPAGRAEEGRVGPVARKDFHPVGASAAVGEAGTDEGAVLKVHDCGVTGGGRHHAPLASGFQTLGS